MSASTVNMEAIKRLRAIRILIESTDQEAKMGPGLLMLLDTVEKSETLLASKPTDDTLKAIRENLEITIDVATREICMDYGITDVSAFVDN